MIYWWCPSCNAEGTLPFTMQQGMTLAEGFAIENSVIRDHNRKVTNCPRFEAKPNQAIQGIVWNDKPILKGKA